MQVLLILALSEHTLSELNVHNANLVSASSNFFNTIIHSICQLFTNHLRNRKVTLSCVTKYRYNIEN